MTRGLGAPLTAALERGSGFLHPSWSSSGLWSSFQDQPLGCQPFTVG